MTRTNELKKLPSTVGLRLEKHRRKKKKVITNQLVQLTKFAEASYNYHSDAMQSSKLYEQVTLLPIY